MLRFLVLVFLPSVAFSQCTTCTQQTGYIGIYGSSGSPNSAQYSSAQYICNSCQSSSNSFQSGYQYSSPQFQCNSCQYSPGVQATTTISPSYNLAQCTCNNCQQQGVQYSCTTCQNNVGASGYGYSATASPLISQQFGDSGLYGNQQNYGYSTTLSPYGSQQYQSPSLYSTSSYTQQPFNGQYNNGYATTLSPYGSQQYQNPSLYSSSSYTQQSYNGQQYNNAFSTTMSPYSNQQGLQYNPSQQGFSTTAAPYMNQQYQSTRLYGSTGQYGGFSTTTSSLASQQFNDPNSNGGSPTRYYNELTNTNLGYPNGYAASAPGTQPLFDQSSANQNNDGTYVSGQYLPGVQGHVYDTRVGLTQFNTQVKRK